MYSGSSLIASVTFLILHFLGLKSNILTNCPLLLVNRGSLMFIEIYHLISYKQ